MGSAALDTDDVEGAGMAAALADGSAAEGGGAVSVGATLGVADDVGSVADCGNNGMGGAL